MMRSMFSAVSGLRAHQSKMDIIGNNIANVNTVGYKGSRVTFQEVFNQTVKGAGSPQSGRGGTNPQQVGLGISMSSIDTLHIRGAVQRTDNNTDLAINGDGFFILSNTADGLSRSYTRAGNFALDESGNLVASNGYKVMGYMVDPVTGQMKSNMDGIVISKAVSSDAKASTFANLEGNLDYNMAKLPAVNLTATPPVPSLTPGNPDVLTLDPGTKYWETTTTLYDDIGGQHNVKLTFIKGMAADGSNATGDDDWAVLIRDENTKKYFANNPATTPAGLTDIIVPLKFKADGKLDTSAGNISNVDITIPYYSADGTTFSSFTAKLDFSKLTTFANESNASVTTKDGYKQGSLDTFSIGPSGEINGIFTNGQNKVIGQIALAMFKNPAGLEKTQENMYQPTPNSGDPINGLPGSSGFGALNPGTLEMSNVDLSKEFTEMISTQRGFQANSRIITSSDEMLQELVNLKR